MVEASPGPPSRQPQPPRQLNPPSTSHLSVVDAPGNAVSMTASIEGEFGSHLMARGFMLNNEMTDFSFAPRAEGLPVANRVAADKRTRSQMSCTLVLGPAGRTGIDRNSVAEGRRIAGNGARGG